MYILETKDNVNFKVVAQCHPANVPADKKKEIPVSNSVTPGLKTFAVYTDKSWKSLPLTKEYENPWPLELK